MSDIAIMSGRNERALPALSAIPDDSVSNFAFLGSFINAVNEVSFVYAEKTYYNDKTVRLGSASEPANYTVKIIPVKSGLIMLSRIQTMNISDMVEHPPVGD